MVGKCVGLLLLSSQWQRWPTWGCTVELPHVNLCKKIMTKFELNEHKPEQKVLTKRTHQIKHPHHILYTLRWQQGFRTAASALKKSHCSLAVFIFETGSQQPTHTLKAINCELTETKLDIFYVMLVFTIWLKRCFITRILVKCDTYYGCLKAFGCTSCMVLWSPCSPFLYSKPRSVHHFKGRIRWCWIEESW